MSTFKVEHLIKQMGLNGANTEEMDDFFQFDDQQHAAWALQELRLKLTKLLYIVVDHLPDDYFDQTKTSKAALLLDLLSLHDSLSPQSFNSQLHDADPQPDDPSKMSSHPQDLRLLSSTFAFDNSLSKRSIRLALDSEQKSVVQLLRNQWSMYQKVQLPIDR